jgi:hypothetical protein
MSHIINVTITNTTHHGYDEHFITEAQAEVVSLFIRTLLAAEKLS